MVRTRCIVPETINKNIIKNGEIIMTQLIKARQGIITPEVERLAKVEGL